MFYFLVFFLTERLVNPKCYSAIDGELTRFDCVNVKTRKQD